MSIFLDTTLKSLEIKLNGAATTTEPPYTCSYVSLLSSDQSIAAVASNDGVTTGGTAVAVCAAPDGTHTRQIKGLSVPNVDTVAVVLTVQLNDNATKRIIWKGTLDVGDVFSYED